MSAGPDARWRVTLGVVLHRSGHVTPHLGQIGRQLEDSVDGSDENLACPLVDGQVGEGGVIHPVRRSATCRHQGGRRCRRSTEEEEGPGEQEEREGGDGGGKHGGRRTRRERKEEVVHGWMKRVSRS